MTDDEMAERRRVVQIARSWRKTPYLSRASVQGAGVDCAMLPLAVYKAAGLIPDAVIPPDYSPQWHIHRGGEMYMTFVLKFAKEIPGPPLAGDFVLFRIARLFAHGGIVTEWPKIIHARSGHPVFEEDISANNFGKHALWKTDKRFFSAWAQ